jgi:hypothetical protein
LTNGRIYKVTFGTPKRWQKDLAELSDLQLVEELKHPNAWVARHAQRLLQERAAGNGIDPKAVETMRVVAGRGTGPERLRGVWALFAAGQLTEPHLHPLLDDRDESVRAWGVRLAVDDKNPPAAIRDRLASRARIDTSPHAWLHLAAALQRLPLNLRMPLAQSLTGHEQFNTDPFLSHMLWYGLEPLASDPRVAGELVGLARVGMVRENLARRVALQGQVGLDMLSDMINPAPVTC